MSNTSSHDVKSSIASLLNSKKYSDLVLQCGDKTFNVHRAVICPQSGFFTAMCDGGFKEASEQAVNLKDDNPDDVERMVTYFYTNDYSDANDEDEEEGEFDAEQQPSQGGGSGGYVAERSAWDSPPRLELTGWDPQPQHPSSTTTGGGGGNDNAAGAVSDDESDDDGAPYINPSDMDIKTFSEQYFKHDSQSEARRKAGALAQLTNIAVYALAEKYDVPGLKSLASVKFRSRRLWTQWWDFDAVVEITRALYSVIPESDKDLRAYMVTLCTNWMRQRNADYLCKDFDGLMEEIPPFRRDLMEEILTCRAQEIANLSDQLRSMTGLAVMRQTYITEKLTDAVENDMKYREEKAKFQNLVAALGNWNSCVRCRAPFAPRFRQEDNPNPTRAMVLRCGRCQTEHRYQVDLLA